MPKKIKTMSEARLNSILKYMLFEYSGPTQSRVTAPGDSVPSSPSTFDKLAGTLDDTTVPSELPLEPTELMASQLATDKPPVEDEEYVPTNSSELSKATSVLASHVPDKDIGPFYTQLKKLIDTEFSDNSDVTFVGEEEDASIIEDEYMGESKHGSALEKILAEVYGEETSLDDLAPVMGKRGASGVRQELERVMKRSRYWAENASMQDIEMLKTVAVGKFIEGLLAGGYINDDEAIDLQQEPIAVKELPSFQFFFVNSMIVPSYRRIRKQAADAAMVVIQQLNIPLRSQQSYINMIMGDVPYSSRKLRQKIASDAQLEGMSQRDADFLSRNAVNRYPDVKREASMGTDFVGNAVQYFDSINPRRLSSLIQSALEATQASQVPVG